MEPAAWVKKYYDDGASQISFLGAQNGPDGNIATNYFLSTSDYEGGNGSNGWVGWHYDSPEADELILRGPRDVRPGRPRRGLPAAVRGARGRPALERHVADDAVLHRQQPDRQLLPDTRRPVAAPYYTASEKWFIRPEPLTRRPVRRPDARVGRRAFEMASDDEPSRRRARRLPALPLPGHAPLPLGRRRLGPDQGLVLRGQPRDPHVDVVAAAGFDCSSTPTSTSPTTSSDEAYLILQGEITIHNPETGTWPWSGRGKGSLPRETWHYGYNSTREETMLIGLLAPGPARHRGNEELAAQVPPLERGPATGAATCSRTRRGFPWNADRGRRDQPLPAPRRDATGCTSSRASTDPLRDRPRLRHRPPDGRAVRPAARVHQTDPERHPGDEVAFCTEGQAAVQLLDTGEWFELNGRDGCFIPAAPHRWFNTTGQPASCSSALRRGTCEPPPAHADQASGAACWRRSAWTADIWSANSRRRSVSCSRSTWSSSAIWLSVPVSSALIVPSTDPTR